MWCGSFYQGESCMGFHIAKPMNDEGLVWNRKDNKGRYDYVFI